MLERFSGGFRVGFAVLIVGLIFLSAPLHALALPQGKQKTLQAQRLDRGYKIKIDGLLSETLWQSTGYSDFVQTDPQDGAAPSEKTTVWLAFDKEALYVAARLYDSEPDKIVKQLSRRDDYSDSDWFRFAVDPYFDKRSGYRFSVNPAGSIMDSVLFNDSWSDDNWDGVWESAARIDDRGWCVEMKIPFDQLRFQKKESYTWGINFHRIIKRKNEQIVYAWVAKEDSGYVSRFAALTGINDIDPGRHLEFLPYMVGRAAFSPREEGNPFATGKDYLVNGGLDLKYGLKSNLTLDITVNPDFGQVEVDPAVINLTAFETYYEEKRPFFIEGDKIFSFGEGGATSIYNLNWGSPSFFYSRRIGRQPRAEVTSDGHVDYPEYTTILGAVKLTGKIGKGWNIGLLNAVTAREYAEIDREGERHHDEVEPTTNYTVVRLQREYNGGRQGLGFMGTSVLRYPGSQNLAESLAKRAFTLGIDGWTFLDKNKVWVLNGWLGSTLLSGSRTAITNIQQSPLHYYQRPDAGHVELDADATTLGGWAGRFRLNKEKGKFIFNTAFGLMSPGFHTNELGFQSANSDRINGHVIVGYREPHPGKLFRNWELQLVGHRAYDFGGHRTGEGYGLLTMTTLLNYWEIDVYTFVEPDTWSITFTRGGPIVRYPGGYSVNAYLYSDSRKKIVLSLHGRHYEDQTGLFGNGGGLSLRIKPGSRFSFSISPWYSYDFNAVQWVDAFADPLMVSTYGSRYVYGEMKQWTFTSELRIDWIFTPRMSLQIYLQPFISVGRYEQFKELARARALDFNRFGRGDSTIRFNEDRYTVDPDGPGPAGEFSFDNPDFNLKSLRGTAVFRYEYRPGSTLYLVWTQNRSDISNPGDFRFKRDFSDMLTAPGDNIFLIKFTHRLKL